MKESSQSVRARERVDISSEGLAPRTTMLKVLLISVVCGVVFFTVGILIGHFAIDKKESIPRWVNELKKDVDEGFIENFINEVDNRNIEENLR